MSDHMIADRVEEGANFRLWREMQSRLRDRLNLPDTSTPEFRAEANRQAALMRGTPEDIEAMDFIEAVMDTDGWDSIDPNE